MALVDILRRVQAETGINSPDLNSSQRPYLIDKINEAAAQIWEAKDLPVVLKECCVKARSNRQLALPAFVGELRAIRGTSSENYLREANWSFKDIRSKYVENEWKRLWKNWRVIGESPIQVEMTNAAPGSIITEEADAELVVTITGATSSSNRTSEAITMTSATMSWTKNFTDIFNIRKNKVSEYDVVIEDADENELSIIYSDQLEARFLIVDISEYPEALYPCSDGSFITEVLYKPRLPRLENDEDVFPLTGYDDIIVLKTKQLIAEDAPGEEQRAFLSHQKADLLLQQKIQDKTSVTKKGISFGRNPLLSHRRLFRGWHCYE